MPFTDEGRRKAGERTRQLLTGVAIWKPRPGVDPIVRFLIDEARAQSVVQRELAAASGVSMGTLRAWNSNRRQRGARLADVEACLNVLGLTLSVAPLRLADRHRQPSAPTLERERQARKGRSRSAPAPSY